MGTEGAGLLELALGTEVLLGQTTMTWLVVEVTVIVEWNMESSVEK